MFQGSLIAIIVVMILVEIYLYTALRKFTDNQYILFGSIMATVFVLSFMAYNFFFFDRNVGQTPRFMWSVGLFMLISFPKAIMLFFFITEDMFRLMAAMANRILYQNHSGSFIPERRKFVFQAAMGFAAIPFLALLHGMTLGKYNFKLLKEKLAYKTLPDAFDGFRILHITDIHSGSLDNRKKIEEAIELINAQTYDLLLFTGDIVNNFHWEMDKWVDVFSKIKKAPYGNFAVLGNHDYGEYSDWKTEELKLDNFNKIKAIFPKIGFELLLNENRVIKKDGQEISLIGIENWGARFKKAGDLAKASKGVDPNQFKILMSHDPSHWDLEVKDHDVRYDLTLSGHTHGMQLGIEVPALGIKWSPSQYVYPQWAGLYEHKDRRVYVNRGFGYHFYPGRVGIWPEITVLELVKG